MRKRHTNPEYFVYEFNEDSGLIPSVACIMRHYSSPLPKKKIVRWSFPYWVLDYTWTPCYPMCVGYLSSPWRFRHERTAHLYPPNTAFWGDLKNASPASSGVAITFEGGSEVGLDKLIKGEQVYAKFNDPQGKLGQVLDELAQKPKEFGDKCYSAVKSGLWDVFHMLFMSQHVEKEDYLIQDTHLPLKETFIVQVENYMRDHYSEKLSLAGIARAFGINPKTLTQRFRKEYKTSPMARLNEIRIDIAKTMLIRGSRINEIAVSIGFSDEFHLSKTFKKITGQSPRDFLKSLE